jgi:predicted glycoside hydrolase/deacetylase ChbG (UPF0249 family)
VAAERNLVVNADDFGRSRGVNRGIIDCHMRGVVTSASLMVRFKAASHAVELSAEHPRLGVGLHWHVRDEDRLDLGDADAVGEHLGGQLAAFERLLGRPPTHVDSHHHVHLDDGVMPVVAEVTHPLGVPVRGDGRLAYVGGFYAQWEPNVTNLEYVSVPFLLHLLREEVGEGWTELSCHPGYMSNEKTGYLEEREAEVRTLTDPAVHRTVDELGIHLRSFADYPRVGSRR